MKKRTFIISLVASGLLGLVPTLTKNVRKARTTLTIFPVKYSKREKNCFEYQGANLLPLSKKATVSLENTNFQFKNGNLVFFINEKTTKSLEKIAQKYDKLALAVDGKVIHTANAKEMNSQESFQMTFRHPQHFEQLLEQISA